MISRSLLTKDMVRSALVIFFCLAVAAPLMAQQTHYFLPFIAGTSSMNMGLALVNPGTAGVSITLTARDYAGNSVTGPNITNPASIQIPASGQNAQLISEIFGSGIGGRTGWVDITASSPVDGFFLLFDLATTFIDGAELQSLPAKRLVFQRVTANTGTSSTIAFVNATGQQLSNLSLTFYGTNGVSQRTLNLPAYSGFSGSITDLIPLSSPADGYAVLEFLDPASSVNSLIGFGTYRNKTDIAALNAATEASPLRSGYLPHLVTGSGYTTNFRLINDSDTSQLVRVTADSLNLDGHGPPGGYASVDTTIPPHGMYSGSVADLFGIESQNLVTGYLRWEVPQPTAGLIGFLDYGSTDGVLLSAIPAQSSMAQDLVFAHVAQGQGFYTGLAFLNINEFAAIVTVNVFDPGGRNKGTATFTLQPGERRSQLLSELVPGLSEQLGGYVRVTSTQPLFTFEVFGSSDSLSFLADVPGGILGGAEAIPPPPALASPSTLTLVSLNVEIPGKLYQFILRVTDNVGRAIPGVPVKVQVSGLAQEYVTESLSDFAGEVTVSVSLTGPYPVLVEASVDGITQKIAVPIPLATVPFNVIQSFIPIGASGWEFTINGSNLDQVTSVSFGHALVSITSRSATQLTLRADVASNELIGPRSLVVQTSNGAVDTSLTVYLTTPSYAMLNSINMYAAAGGKTMIKVSAANGQLIRNLRAISDPSITFDSPMGDLQSFAVTVNVPAGALFGPRALAMETDEGTYPIQPQLIVYGSQQPTAVFGPSPSDVFSGATTPIIVQYNFAIGERLTGFSFQKVGVDDPSILVVGFRQSDPPEIFKANVDVAESASPGERTLVLMTNHGPIVTNRVLNVVAPDGGRPVISISPSQAALGSRVVLSITGAGLMDNASVNVSGMGVTVSDTPTLSDHVLSTLLTIDAAAEPGDREITVTTPSGTSSPVKFTVVSP